MERSEKNGQIITCLPCRNHADADQRPLESTDHPRSTDRNQTVFRIKKSVGKISQKVLTSNLRSMEESGLVSRKVYPEVPPRVEYSLTETGWSLKPILDAMVEWGTEYKQKHENETLQ